MRGTNPAPDPDALAYWLLLSAGGAPDSREDTLMAAIHIYDQLRAHLSIFLGVAGFDSLWARSLYLLRRTMAWDTDPPVAATPHQLDLLIAPGTVAEAAMRSHALVSQFLSLLFTFIGADLGFRLLQQRWPALPVPLAYAQGEELSQ